MIPREKGFTLFEILLTIILLSVGVVALMQAFSTGLFVSQEAEGMDLALNLAQSRMEEITGKDYDTISAEGDSGPAPDADFPDFQVAVDIAELQDPMRVDVTVSWSTRGGDASVTLTTLVSDI